MLMSTPTMPSKEAGSGNNHKYIFLSILYTFDPSEMQFKSLE